MDNDSQYVLDEISASDDRQYLLDEITPSTKPVKRNTDPKRWERVMLDWPAHGEGKLRSELIDKINKEAREGVRGSRQALRATGATIGGIVGARSGSGLATGMLGGAGYGAGDIAGSLIYGEDPEREFNKLPPLVQVGLKTPVTKDVPALVRPLRGLAREGLRPEVLSQSVAGLVAAPYEIARSVAEPLVQGDFKGAGKAALAAGLGYVDIPYTVSGLKDIYQKLSGRQPMDWEMREAQAMAEQDPAGTIMGTKMTVESPKKIQKMGTMAKHAAMRFIPEKYKTQLYQSALQPSTSPEERIDIEKAVEQGLEDKAIISRGARGLKETQGRMQQYGQEADAILQASQARLPLLQMRWRLKDMAEDVRYNDPTNYSKVNRSVDKFLTEIKKDPDYDATTDTISVQRAADIKKKYYIPLDKRNAYGVRVPLSPEETANKGIAKVMMTLIDNALPPEYKTANLEYGKRANLHDYLYRATQKLRNSRVMSTAFGYATMIGAFSSTPEAALLPLAVAMINRPVFKSKLAIAIHHAHKNRISAAEARRLADSAISQIVVGNIKQDTQGRDLEIDNIEKESVIGEAQQKLMNMYPTTPDSVKKSLERYGLSPAASQ